MGSNLGSWFARKLTQLVCGHEWELVEEQKAPGRVPVARTGVDNLGFDHFHRVQRWRCRKCGAVKIEHIPLC
jgi:hypothetical protein